MRNVTRVALLTLAVYGSSMAAAPWAAGWTVSNPFSSGSSSSTKNKQGKKVGSARRTASKPGVVETLSSAPKKLYTNTKAMVTPNKPTKKPASNSRPRTDTWKTSSAAQQASQKPSGIKGLFAPEPAPLPRTVGEWMKQKRIDP